MNALWCGCAGSRMDEVVDGCEPNVMAPNKAVPLVATAAAEAVMDADTDALAETEVLAVGAPDTLADGELEDVAVTDPVAVDDAVAVGVLVTVTERDADSVAETDGVPASEGLADTDGDTDGDTEGVADGDGAAH